MKLFSQAGIPRVLFLLGTVVLFSGLPVLIAAPAPQEGSDTVAEAPAETPGEAPAEEQAEVETGESVETFVGEALEDVVSVHDARVYRGGEVSIMTSIHIPANEVHRGDVACIGCEAVIEGEVTGDIVVVGGSLTLSGKAGHDLVCVLSDVELQEGAEIDHDFVAVMSNLDDFGATFGRERFVMEPFIGLPSIGGAFGVLGAMILWGKALKFVVVFLVILILAIFVPERIRVLSDEFPTSYGLAWLVGLGGYAILWVVNLLLVISVIGIPVAILLHLLFLVLKVLGLAGIFHFIGARLGRSMSREMSLLGAVFLGFIIFALILTLPHFFGIIGLAVAATIRGVFWLLFELPAIGLVLLTRAGGRPLHRPQVELPAAPAPPAPPAAPMPPQTPAPPNP